MKKKILFFVVLMISGIHCIDESVMNQVLDYLHMHNRVLNVCPMLMQNVHQFYKEQFANDKPQSLNVHKDPLTNIHNISDSSMVICTNNLDQDSIYNWFNISDGFKITTKHSWLLFYNDQSIEEIFRSLKIPMDRRVFLFQSENHLLFESYWIDRTREVWRLLANFSTERPKIFHDQDFAKRRANLAGKKLRVLVEDQIPYVMFDQHEEKLPDLKSPELYELSYLNVTSGMFIQILKILEKEMNFSSVLLRRYDGKWGSMVNGSWDGMVSNLVNRDVDIVATSLTLTPERFDAVQPLFPAGTETYAIYIKNPDREEIDWTIYKTPFTVELWYFLFMAACFMALCLRLADIIYVAALESDTETCTGIPLKLLCDCWLVFSSYLGGKAEKTPGSNRWGQRLLLVFVLLCGNMIFMCYRASITSELATWSIKMPFHDLPSLLANGNYKLSTSKGGLMESLFRDAPEGSVFRELYQELMDHENPFLNSIENGLKNVVEGEKEAFFYTLEAIRSLKEKECKILAPWITEFPGFLAYATPKDSPFHQFFYYKFLQLVEKGTLSVIKHRWSVEEPMCSQSRVASLGYEKIVTVFFIIVIGTCLAIVIFCFECILVRYKPISREQRRRSKRKWQRSVMLEQIRLIIMSPHTTEDQIKEFDTLVQDLKTSLTSQRG